mgnify:CR=1 FL=1|jgi:hypothetical protein|tara:strand:- start:1161 stop:1493 length:333 start_codon:yes stop_codon:yes gene_type:complete
MNYYYRPRYFVPNTIIGNIISEFVAPTDDELIEQAKRQVGIIGGQQDATFCNPDDLHKNEDGSWTVEVWHIADKYIMQWDGQMQEHAFPGFTFAEIHLEAWADVLDEEDW